MANTPASDASVFQGANPVYKVSIDPTTGKSILVGSGAVDPATGQPSSQTTPYYIYADKNGNFTFYNNPDDAIAPYLKDIAASGNQSKISKQLYDNQYITQKQFTSNNKSAFVQGLAKYIMDFGVDQATNMAIPGGQTKIVPFLNWVSSSAGQAGSTGKSGNVTDSTTTAQLTSKAVADFQFDGYMFDALGRKATASEKKQYLTELNAAEQGAAAKRQSQSTTVTGPDSQATTTKDTVTGGTQLTQADYDRIMAGIITPIISQMSTDDLLKTNGSVAKSIVNLQAYAADYGLPNYTADVAKKDILGKMKTGGITSTTAESPEQLAIRTMAKAYYPNLANQIDQGVKVSTLANSYASHIEKTLELPSGSVNLNDQYITKALQNKDATGKVQDGVMNINDFEKQLRADPRWSKTQGAKEEASSYVNSILQSFGLVG